MPRFEEANLPDDHRNDDEILAAPDIFKQMFLCRP
jgi:hypothetical protein